MENDLISDFVKNITPDFVAIVNALVDVIERSGHSLDSAIKWKKLTFGKDNDFHHWLCSINISKKSVGLNFHFGGLLEDPKNLFKVGTSKFLRQLEYKSVMEINDMVIIDFLGQAVSKLQYFKDNWKEIQKTK